MNGSTTAKGRPLADTRPPNVRPHVASAAPTMPTAADRTCPSRPPESRPLWETSVYASSRTLPPGRKVRGRTYVAVLLRWAHYASWSGGRPGINGRPAVETLAADVGVSEKTVDRVLALAVELGQLARTAGRQGGLNPRAATHAARIPVVELDVQTGPLEVPHEVVHRSGQTGPPQVPSDSSRSSSDGTPEPFRRDPRAVQTGPPEVPRPHRPQDPHHPRARDAVASPLFQLLDGGGGGNEEQDDRTDAAGIVDKLAGDLRLGPLDRAQLVPAVARVLADGRWTPEALTSELSRELPARIHFGLHLVRHRLDNLPPPPAALAVAAAPGKPWCGRCHSPGYRWVVVDDDDSRPRAKCECHPGYAAAASA